MVQGLVRVMSLGLFFPLLSAAVLLIAVTRTAFRRSPYKRIDDAILFIRRLEVADVDALLDAGQEWRIRNLLSAEDFRGAQGRRLHLAQEYLRRVAHNAEVIQGWMAEEYEGIRHKTEEEFSPKDRLVQELLRVSTDLRLCSFAALVQVGVWKMLRLHLWPMRFVPRLPNLRVVCGFDVIGTYQKLRELTGSLSLAYGQGYYERMNAAFSYTATKLTDHL